MAENITARDLMLPEFTTIRSDRTLGDALGALLELQVDQTRANALAVVGAGGGFEGIVTAHLLFKSLLAVWSPGKNVREDPERLQRELLTVAADRAGLSVHDTLIRGLPTAAPGDRLLDLIEAGCDQRLEFIPVVEGGHLLGLVPISAVFQATAALALTPEHEGIRFEDDPKGS